jgi:putative ABC transport system permease protein
MNASRMFAWIKSIASRIRARQSPAEVDQEFSRELESHLEMLTNENIRRGMPPEEAKRAARIRLGGATQLHETNRELRGLPLVETFLQDARYALRMLRRNAGFTAVCVLTLALGIGVNTAIFSVVYAVILKPLPYPDSQQLYTIFQQRTQDSSAQAGFSNLDLQDVIAQATSFSGMTGITSHELTLTGRGDPFIVRVADVTPELFSVFEQQPILGRMLRPEDGVPGAAHVVVLNESVWRSVFSADPNIIGASINLDKRAFTVVGVMPATFSYPLLAGTREVWIPVGHDPMFESWMNLRARHWLLTTGRLKPGVSLAEAQSELDVIGKRLAKQFPAEDAGWEIHLLPLQRLIVGDVRSPLLILLGAVTLVLVIACANLANLLLTRATSRTREIAVRTALGASRGRIVRQLLSETAVLGVLGGAVGIFLAYWGVHALAALVPKSVPQLNPIRVDGVVLAFALGISVFAIFLFGLAPAFLAAKSDPQVGLREGGTRSGESAGGRRARSIFAGAEIALAMVLLVTAGLLIRSFSKLTSVSPGFETAHIVKANVSLPRAQYKTPQQWLAFTEDLLARVQAEPGMHDAALVVPTPLADIPPRVSFEIVGQPPASAAESRIADFVATTPNYLHVMEIPLVAGRFFSADDAMSTPRVTVISAAMARVYFPDENPIGKQISFSFPPTPGVPREIVGIVGDVRDSALGEDPKPMMYVPFEQSPFWGSDLVVKSTLPVSNVTDAMRRDTMAIDKDLPIGDIAKMTDVLSTNVAEPRFRTWLLALFAAMALVLAATGIFGVIAYSVSRRTQEIGIRIALGASRGAISQMVLRETMLLTLVGLGIGVPCALGASHLVGHLLFGVSAKDPITLGLVALILGAVAAVAGYIPARRAMHVDPMVALRHD